MNDIPHRREVLDRLKGYAVSRAMRGFEAFVLLFSRPRKRGRDVVVVRLDAIGDFVLWLDAAKEFRRLYPSREITLLANSIWAELARELPYWDEVWSVNGQQLRRYSVYRWKLLRALRQRGFDVAIQPTYSRVFLEGDTLVRASGARERIGSIGDDSCIHPKQKRIADRWERNAEFMRNLGRKEFAAAIPALPKLAGLPEHLRIAMPYFILVPGASWSGRQWPPDRFAEIANRLGREMGLKAVICGSGDESALCQRVVEHTEVEVLNLAGQTSLLNLVELVRGARLLISNETSATHIAAAVGTPALCILGGGHYGRFLPYEIGSNGDKGPKVVVHRMPCFGCNWNCSQPHQHGESVPCVGRIAVQDVLRAVEQAVAGVHAPSPA